VSQKDHVVRHIFVGDDRDVFQLRFQLRQLPLNGAILFLGEVVLGIFREVAQRSRLANPLLNFDLRLVKLLPF
jgi:hypothetical protein